MRTLILTSNNIVAGSNNSQLLYKFPAGSINLVKGQKVALQSLTMYNSIFNITALNQNNSFSYIWVDGTTNIVNIPDGYYEIPSLNAFLESVFISNKHYLIDNSNGKYVYFIAFTINPNAYAIQVNCFPMNNGLYPLGSTSGTFSLPAGQSWSSNGTLSATTIVPILIVPNNNFSVVMGFNAGKYPNATIVGSYPTNITETPTQLQTTQSFLSTTTPQVSPLSSLILTCSLINNNYAIPNKLLFSFAPVGTIGQQFTIQPSGNLSFIDCQAGQYASFSLEFYDQNLRPVVIQDPQINILLLISDVSEITQK
jgi:hypothetical protein